MSEGFIDTLWQSLRSPWTDNTNKGNSDTNTHNAQNIYNTSNQAPWMKQKYIYLIMIIVLLIVLYLTYRYFYCSQKQTDDKSSIFSPSVSNTSNFKTTSRKPQNTRLNNANIKGILKNNPIDNINTAKQVHFTDEIEMIDNNGDSIINTNNIGSNEDKSNILNLNQELNQQKNVIHRLSDRLKQLEKQMTSTYV